MGASLYHPSFISLPFILCLSAVPAIVILGCLITLTTFLSFFFFYCGTVLIALKRDSGLGSASWSGH